MIYLDDLFFRYFFDGDALATLMGQDHLTEGTFAELPDHRVAEDLIIIHLLSINAQHRAVYQYFNNSNKIVTPENNKVNLNQVTNPLIPYNIFDINTLNYIEY